MSYVYHNLLGTVGCEQDGIQNFGGSVQNENVGLLFRNYWMTDIKPGMGLLRLGLSQATEVTAMKASWIRSHSYTERVKCTLHLAPFCISLGYPLLSSLVSHTIGRGGRVFRSSHPFGEMYIAIYNE